MKISVTPATLKEAAGLLVIPVTKSDISKKSKLFNQLDTFFGFSILTELKRRSFSAAKGKNIVIEVPAEKKIKAIAFYGWDSIKKSDPNLFEAHRLLGATIASSCQTLSLSNATLFCTHLSIENDTAAAALLEGIELTTYRFSRYKKSNKIAPLKQLLLTDTKKSMSPAAKSLAKATVAATCLARDLVNTPGKDCKPRDLVATARKIAKGTPLKVRVYDKAQLTKMGAGALLSVAAGSVEPPFLIKITYTPTRKAAKDIAIVGKGITFDSGGLSIKTGDGMMEMKMDMGGAAAVLGTMQALSILKPAVKVTAYIPTSENMINGKASKPGDVVTAINGKTIEILNTDAEGRLALADALSVASKENHDTVIDLATLTGAVMIALGEEYAGLYATTDALAHDLEKAGTIAGERLWRLPLAPEYETHIESPIADIKNIGNGRYAGSITAALFLKHFVKAKNWAHLDIAGTAFRKSNSDYRPAGGVGFGVRTLIQYLLKQ